MPFENKKIFIFDVLDSTNEWLKKNGFSLDSYSVCIAKKQTAGRGRSGNSWMSEEGNFYGSILLKPDGMTPKQAGLVSFVTAVSLYHTLYSIVPKGVSIGLKWPNDVLVNGKKISGILLESEIDSDGMIDYLVVGVGVNIAVCPPLDTATSLKDMGVVIDMKDFIRAFLTQFDKSYSLFCQHGFEAIRTDWLANALYQGETIRVRLPNEQFEARFIDLDANGHLVVELKGGEIKKIASGDVFF